MNLIHGGLEYLQTKILECIFDIREFILNWSFWRIVFFILSLFLL
jgi:hypothetical protein